MTEGKERKRIGRRGNEKRSDNIKGNGEQCEGTLKLEGKVVRKVSALVVPAQYEHGCRVSDFWCLQVEYALEEASPQSKEAESDATLASKSDRKYALITGPSSVNIFGSVRKSSTPFSIIHPTCSSLSRPSR